MSDAAPSSATDAALAAEAAPSVAKANDLDAIKRSVEDAASVSGSLWLSYLFLLFYLAIAVGAVSHVDLFLENPVKLPFLGIELPLKAFFLLAPLLFCISHVYTLTYFVILSDKAKRYHSELRRQIAGDDDPDSAASLRARDIRNQLQHQLPSNIFVQFLAGPDDIRASALGIILKLIAWVTLVIAPVLLLLLIQVQFLPYHDHIILWTIRFSLLFDIAILWWLWQAVLLGRGEARRPLDRQSMPWTVVTASISILAIIFSWMIATFPGEWMEANLANRPFIPDVDGKNAPTTSSIHDFLFNRPVNSLTRRRGIFLSSTLVLPLFDIFEFLKIKDTKDFGPYKYVFRARGRDFRGAVFELSNLSNVDFEGADLTEAKLDRATLQNTSMFCARMSGVILTDAKLQGTWFYGARMWDAKLEAAQGQGALFDGAQLQGAGLDSANFQAASFESADLTGATLRAANLEAASFEKREGLAADCIPKSRPPQAANLEKASLDRSSLVAASFAGARLVGTTHDNVKLDGADFAAAAGVSAEPTRQAQAPAGDPAKRAFLAKTFRGFVCSGDAKSIFILRGLLATDRLKAAGPEVLPLLNDIASGASGCPTAALDADDTTNVLKLRKALSEPPPEK